ncbi:betaine--homocysteine S-methyltransferase [bacterium]|nr:betaine--homocysteine S-methyltransferase [bacterium]
MQTLTTQAELEAFCTRAQGYPYVTIDTEFLRERTYYSKLCLLQMAVPGENEADAVLVDPLSSEMSLEPLYRLFRDTSVVKVFHAARQDLEIFWNDAEIFHEQAEGLKAGGADVAWVETISFGDEYRAAAEAFALADMPWVGTMSFDTAGRTMMGITAPDMVKLLDKIPNKPLAFGANCGVGASDLLRTILGFSATGTQTPIVAKGNAGIPKYHDGHIHYDGTPELMAHYATLARDCGATIIGGCCGTTPEHLRAMRTALETHVPQDRPSLQDIESALGGFSSGSDGTDGTGPTRLRQNRRRRSS